MKVRIKNMEIVVRLSKVEIERCEKGGGGINKALRV